MGHMGAISDLENCGRFTSRSDLHTEPARGYVKPTPPSTILHDTIPWGKGATKESFKNSITETLSLLQDPKSTALDKDQLLGSASTGIHDDI